MKAYDKSTNMLYDVVESIDFKERTVKLANIATTLKLDNVVLLHETGLITNTSEKIHCGDLLELENGTKVVVFYDKDDTSFRGATKNGDIIDFFEYMSLDNNNDKILTCKYLGSALQANIDKEFVISIL